MGVNKKISHTPGPWIWTKFDDETHAPDPGHEDCHTHYCGLHSPDPDKPVISSCTYEQHNLRPEDAALIAAAPELLDAALAAAALIRGSGFTPGCNPLVQLTAAIARARGEVKP